MADEYKILVIDGGTASFCRKEADQAGRRNFRRKDNGACRSGPVKTNYFNLLHIAVSYSGEGGEVWIRVLKNFSDANKITGDLRVYVATVVDAELMKGGAFRFAGLLPGCFRGLIRRVRGSKINGAIFSGLINQRCLYMERLLVVDSAGKHVSCDRHVEVE